MGDAPVNWLNTVFVLAIAFLALSNRERGSVSVSADLTAANLAAQNAFERALAQTVAGHAPRALGRGPED